jgi:hypothetical protein
VQNERIIDVVPGEKILLPGQPGGEGGAKLFYLRIGQFRIHWEAEDTFVKAFGDREAVIIPRILPS